MALIDITNLVDAFKTTWITWAVNTVMLTTAAVPWLSWLNFPVIAPLVRLVLEKVVTVIANGVEMEGFFLNTAIRKASQAGDFVSARDAMTALPPTATFEEYKNAENQVMAAFRSLVSVTT